MRILGVDPASKKCGYGCIDVHRQRIVYVEAGVLEAPARAPLYDRIAEIGQDLEQLLDDLKPDALALEAGFVKYDAATLAIGGARAVAAYLARRRGIPVSECAPSAAKKTATGRGDATKEQVAALLRLQLRLKQPLELDAADALAVAIHAARIQSAYKT